MAVIKSSIPYANALFQLAKEKNLLDKMKEDMTQIRKVCAESVAFQALISNPTISNKSKKEIFAKLFDGKIEKETLGFLNLLITKGRIGEVASVCEAFINKCNEANHMIVVKLTTASAISDESKKQIATKYLGNSKYELVSDINTSLLGGYVLEYDNKILDNSIASKILKLKHNFNKI